jgi:hypothetical protein
MNVQRVLKRYKRKLQFQTVVPWRVTSWQYFVWVNTNDSKKYNACSQQVCPKHKTSRCHKLQDDNLKTDAYRSKSPNFIKVTDLTHMHTIMNS